VVKNLQLLNNGVLMRITRFWQVFIIGFFMLASLGHSYAAGPLFDMQGKPSSIDKFTGKGKWLVVMFWASDCHVCNREAHQYVDFHFAHSDTDASVLGISLDGLANKVNAQEFIDKHKVNFPNLIGEPEQVAQLFSQLTGVAWRGTPTFLIYSPQGELLVQQIGAVPTDLIENFMASHQANSNGNKTTKN
jgi:peroxiredoxin